MNNFIGLNPCTSFNNKSVMPSIEKTAYIGPFSCVIGDVTIKKNVYIACNASIRADEGTPFFIGENTNIQDGVILHGLAGKSVIVDGREYSIYVDKSVSCAHGSVLHGPCFVGEGCFVGVNAVIFQASVKKNCYIGIGSTITGGVVVPENRLIPPNSLIDTQEKADALEFVSTENIRFAGDIIKVNQEFTTSYSKLD